MNSIYLAGPLDYANLGDKAAWRERFAALLGQHSPMSAQLPLLYDPSKPFTNPLSSPDTLVSVNMAALEASSIVIALVISTEPSWGTPIEIWEARRQGKPVLLWVPNEDCPPYLIADTERYLTLNAIAARTAEMLYQDADTDLVTTSQDLLYENGGIQFPKISGDVGYDVEVMSQTRLLPHAITKVPLGFNGEPLRVKTPRGTWFSMFPRSSMVDKGLMVVKTVCDEGYTGDLFMFVYNTTNKLLMLLPGQRIGQIVLFDSVTPQMRHVSTLPRTARGSNGFGSTGT